MNANTSQIPVCLLNPRAEPVQVYKRTEVAVLELVDVPGKVNVVISKSQEKQEMLHGLVETQGAGLAIRSREDSSTFSF